MLSLGRPLGKPLGNPLALRNGKGTADAVPTRVGTPFGGGYYIGKMRGGDGRLYAIICCAFEAPFDVTHAIQAGNVNENISRSDWDAHSNHASMIASSLPYDAAESCADYRGGGFSDWVLPAYAQLVMMYRAFKPDPTLNKVGDGENPYALPNPGPYTLSEPAQTALPEFQAGNSESFTPIQYHSSTLSGATNNIITFSNGTQNNQGALSALRPVRAIRMIRIVR